MYSPHGKAPIAVPALTPAHVGILHLASRFSGEGPALLTALATMIPCDAGRLAAVRIEHIDRTLGALPVPGENGSTIDVVLGFNSSLAVLNAIGDRREGFLIPDPHGDALMPDDDTENYAREILASADPRSAFPWSFRAIRECMLATLLDHDMPYAIVEAQLGLPPVCIEHDRIGNVLAQRVAADWWGANVGIPMASAFHLVEFAIQRRRSGAADSDSLSGRGA